MRRTAEQVAIGQRMRAAAREAGLSAYQIAPQLGVKAWAVYRWWDGERTPSSELMIAYARLVGKPVGFFYGQENEAAEPSRELVELLFGWAQLLMAGEELSAAFDRASGDPETLTPTEREQLAAAAPRMREDLTRAAGGDWDLLTEAEQRQILDQIARLVEQRRSAAVEGPS